MKVARIRFLEKGEQAVLFGGGKLLPKRWQRRYLEKRKPFRMVGDTIILQTEAEQAVLWRKNAEKLLKKLKAEGVEIVIPPVEGELPQEILPFADGRRLTHLFAFVGAAEALRRQGKNPEECRYLMAGGREAAWRSALISMGDAVNHLAVFTIDPGSARELSQELLEEYGLMAEVFSSPKNPAFGQADVVFGCGFEQYAYEHMLKNGAIWIDLAGNRPVLRRLQERRQDVTVIDGFFFGRKKQQTEGRYAEAEAFLSCDLFRENHHFPLPSDVGKKILCELQEKGYAVSGFSILGKRVKIRKI